MAENKALARRQAEVAAEKRKRDKRADRNGEAKVTLDELRQELEQKESQMRLRISALQDEVMTMGPAVQKAVVQHPLVSVGGALVAGLAVGLLFGGSSKPKGASARRQALVEQYIDAIAEETRYAARRGKDAGDAISKALRSHTPLVVYEPQAVPSHGFLRQTFELLLTTALGYAVKMGVDYLTQNFQVEERIADLLHDDAIPPPGVY